MGIMDQLPGGLSGVRADASGSTATYRVINKSDDREGGNPSITRPLGALGYGITQRVTTMAKRGPSKEEETNELALRVTGAEIVVVHMMMGSNLLGYIEMCDFRSG